MKESILANLLDMHQATEAAIQHFNNDKEQEVLQLANDIRNLAWAVKEEIFRTRLLDAKITGKAEHNKVKVMARARHVSTSLDDLLDLL